MTEYDHRPQAQSGPGFAFVVFDGEQGASMDALQCSHESYPFSDRDKAKVRAAVLLVLLPCLHVLSRIILKYLYGYWDLHRRIIRHLSDL